MHYLSSAGEHFMEDHGECGMQRSEKVDSRRHRPGQTEITLLMVEDVVIFRRPNTP
jgi:hypothetical protein